MLRTFCFLELMSKRVMNGNSGEFVEIKTIELELGLM
jgi:hypothetical protein